MSACDLLCLDLETAEGLRARLAPARTAELAAILKTFGDPTRLLIAQALLEHELCGCDLAWITGQSDKVVSHHLARLRREDLVESRREGRVVFASLTGRGRALLGALEQVSACA
ncbi:MAG: putative ArsR family transcriptional regulator [Solirubrobacterales bacterium]|nr:putative ArsR family transcriptional regulator [Solirubrobacterales bacterium]